MCLSKAPGWFPIHLDMVVEEEPSELFELLCVHMPHINDAVYIYTYM